MYNPSFGQSLAWLVSAWFALLCNANAGAGPGAVADPLRLDQAIARTLEHNPALRAVGHQLDAQDARVQQAGLRPIAELDLTVENALGSSGFSGLDSAETTLSIAWTLDRGIRQRKLDAARANSALLAIEGDRHRLDAAAETARRFVACLASQARRINIDHAVRFAGENVEAVRKRVIAGSAAQAELARAQAELARITLEREDIEHEMQSAARRLAAQWGDTQPAFTHVSGDLLSLPDTATFSALEQRLAQSPDLARYLSQQRVDETLLRLAEVEHHAGWRVSAGIRHLEATDDQALVASIGVPLASRNRNQGNIAAAEAELAVTAAEAEDARVRLVTSLFVLHQELLHARHRVETLRDSVIPHLDQALAGMREGYERGRYSYFEWRSVQAELLEARLDMLDASVDVHLRVIEIERLTGVTVAQRSNPH